MHDMYTQSTILFKKKERVKRSCQLQVVDNNNNDHCPWTHASRVSSLELCVRTQEHCHGHRYTHRSVPKDDEVMMMGKVDDDLAGIVCGIGRSNTIAYCHL